MLKEVDISHNLLRRIVKEDLELKLYKDLMTIAALKCLQAKTAWQRGENVRGDAVCHRQSLCLAG